MAKFSLVIFLLICCLTKKMANNRNKICYLPDGCQFLDNVNQVIYSRIQPTIIVRILCNNLHAVFDYKRFNESYRDCKKEKYFNYSKLKVIIKPRSTYEI